VKTDSGGPDGISIVDGNEAGAATAESDLLLRGALPVRERTSADSAPELGHVRNRGEAMLAVKPVRTAGGRACARACGRIG
jgi:hypothetical protein